jgi:cyclic pyranopterin monophosphate synthase
MIRAAMRRADDVGCAPLLHGQRWRCMVPPSSPDPQPPPAALLEALGAARPLPASTWAALSAVERDTLDNLAADPENLGPAYDRIVGASRLSSHLSSSGAARMVDVSGKQITLRRAVASSRIRMSAETLGQLAEAPKGDVLAAARIAGIMAAKKTSDLIPLCHPVPTTSVRVDIQASADPSAVLITATAETLDRTGVEMEAMVAASVAALTIYDMLKGIERGMVIEHVRLEHKEGGRSGTWQR